MAFRLKHRRSIGTELCKIVRKEFTAALEQLDSATPTQEAIHEARKSVKKIRAELRLLHDSLGSKYAKDNARLRAAAHLLSSLRDADAAVETIGALRQQYHAVLTPAVARGLRLGLSLRKRRARSGAGLHAHRAAAALRRSRKAIERQIRHAGSVAAVRDGVARGYRRARTAMKQLGVDSDAARFHRWRRRLKDHWYHVRLFERLHPTPRGRARALRRLEKWLGEDHNLDMLRHLLLDAPDRYGGARVTALALGCIDKHQQMLRRRALAAGHRMFAAKPAEFRHAATEWW